MQDRRALALALAAAAALLAACDSGNRPVQPSAGGCEDEICAVDRLERAYEGLDFASFAPGHEPYPQGTSLALDAAVARDIFVRREG